MSPPGFRYISRQESGILCGWLKFPPNDGQTEKLEIKKDGIGDVRIEQEGRRTFDKEFKKEVACLVTGGRRKISEVSRDIDIHPNGTVMEAGISGGH